MHPYPPVLLVQKLQRPAGEGVKRQRTRDPPSRKTSTPRCTPLQEISQSAEEHSTLLVALVEMGQRHWRDSGLIVVDHCKGRICGDRSEPLKGEWPNCGGSLQGYSSQIRQKVHYHYQNRSGYTIVTTPPVDESALDSLFCLSPPGSGYDSHQVMAAFKGCVPLVIGNNIYQHFEPHME
eukprot:gene31281-6426_t